MKGVASLCIFLVVFFVFFRGKSDIATPRSWEKKFSCDSFNVVIQQMEGKGHELHIGLTLKNLRSNLGLGEYIHRKLIFV